VDHAEFQGKRPAAYPTLTVGESVYEADKALIGEWLYTEHSGRI
jgi:hypothetical protein